MKFKNIAFLFLFIIFITGCQSQNAKIKTKNPEIVANNSSVPEKEQILTNKISVENLLDIKNFEINEDYFLIENVLKEYPNTKIVLNINDDDIPLEKNQSTIKINDTNVASLDFQVSKSTNFKESLNFSETLNNKINSIYPDISRGVLIQTQKQISKFPSNVVVINIGGPQNTLAEKQATMNILGKVIKKDFLDENKIKKAD